MSIVDASSEIITGVGLLRLVSFRGRFFRSSREAEALRLEEGGREGGREVDPFEAPVLWGLAYKAGVRYRGL